MSPTMKEIAPVALLPAVVMSAPSRPEKLTPSARPRMTAATMTLRDFWKFVWFSTMLRTPTAEIMP